MSLAVKLVGAALHMTTDTVLSNDNQIPLQTLLELADATPAERSEIVLTLIGDRADSHLVLANEGNQVTAVLDEVDLSPAILRERLSPGESAPWWDPDTGGVNLRGARLAGASLRHAKLQGANLQQADLRGATLRTARLQQAVLERANLEGADLAGADLRRAELGEINLQGAMLEDADLRGANLRFARLAGAVLENANLQDADLWGADLRDAVLPGARLKGTVLREANLAGARLSKADLREATVGNTKLQNADLSEARLEGVNLSNSDIHGIYLSDAWLDRTSMRREQLGGAIGEELAGDYTRAARGYLVLERNFTYLGDHEAVSWAYRRRRRMLKGAALKAAVHAWQQGDYRTALASAAQFMSDRFVEWLCDYGESIPRVLRAIFSVYLLFTLIYLLTGSVVEIVETSTGTVTVPTRNLMDVATFSLLAMSTSGSPAVGLQPRNALVHMLTASEALIGIALTGLLGYVVAHRIMR